jgi:hypothetical protein
MFFTHEGFSRSQADHLLYVKQTGEYLLIVIIYGDDLIILTSNVNILKRLKSRLEDEFEMSDLGVGAISWNCKRQPTIALSTTEAEYMATSQCTKEAIWLRKLMADVGLVQVGATSIMCDNQGCIALAKNPTHHSRTKHIDIQHHFIREKLESGEIGLKYCPTQDMVADVLTKALAKERHQNLTRSMGLGVLDYLQSGSVEDYDVDET